MRFLPVVALVVSSLSLTSARSIDEYSGQIKELDCKHPGQHRGTISAPAYDKCIPIMSGTNALWSKPDGESYEIYLYSDKDCKNDEYNLGYTDMCTLILDSQKYLKIKKAAPEKPAATTTMVH